MLNSNQQYDQYQVNNPQQNQSYISQQQYNQAIQFSLYSTQLSMSNYKRKVEFDYLIVKKYKKEQGELIK